MFRIFQKFFGALTVPKLDDATPQDGDVIRQGIILNAHPKLADPYFIKFAFTQHPLFRDPARYIELKPFLPKELSFTAAPDPKLNCFSFVSGDKCSINRFQFMEKLNQQGYQLVENGVPQRDDVVCYYYLFNSDAPSHAAFVREVNGNYITVESRWGEANPVLRHPIGQVLPEWMDEDFGSYKIYRKLH